MAAKISNPPKTFDDQLERMVQHLKANKLSLPGLDNKTLEADLKMQREERQADIELFSRYETAHKRFLAAQSERYARYMKAVRLLRAASDDDPAGLRGLEQFKRPRGSRKPAEPTPTPTDAPVVKPRKR